MPRVYKFFYTISLVFSIVCFGGALMVSLMSVFFFVHGEEFKFVLFEINLEAVLLIIPAFFLLKTYKLVKQSEYDLAVKKAFVASVVFLLIAVASIVSKSFDFIIHDFDLLYFVMSNSIVPILFYIAYPIIFFIISKKIRAL